MRERCVSFILLKDKKFLAEKRKDSHIVCIPGGHLELTETKEQALDREVFEELTVRPLKWKYLGEYPVTFEGEELLVFYFAITKWIGEVKANEAEEIYWLSLNDLSKLTNYEDRFVVQSLAFELENL